MLLYLFGVEPVLLLPVFLVVLGIARVRRSRPIVRCNFLGVSGLNRDLRVRFLRPGA